jgi:hypothetical protein
MARNAKKIIELGPFSKQIQFNLHTQGGDFIAPFFYRNMTNHFLHLNKSARKEKAPPAGRRKV